MDLIDRTAIPSLHAAARHHRSVHVGCLLTSFKAWLGSFFHAHPATRSAGCA
jgi:hypothetical protein